MDFRDDLADVLAAARFRANLSRPALAALSGISEDTILKLEKGKAVPRGQTVYALANALDIDVTTLHANPATEVAQ